MSMYSSDPSGYVSCIRIAGIPILPPLITEERRKDIQRDKNKALLLEKRLKHKRHSTDSGVMISSYTDDSKIPDCKSQNNWYFSTECYTDDINSVTDLIEDLFNSYYQGTRIDENYVKNAIEDEDFKRFLHDYLIKSLKDNHDNNVLDKNSFGSLKLNVEKEPTQGLSSNRIEKGDSLLSLCTEDTDVDLQPTIGWTDNTNVEDKLDVSVCKNLSLVSPRLGNEIFSKNNSEDKQHNLPVLIRRNSYVVESPSPALLQHIQNNPGSSEEVNNETKIEFNENEQPTAVKKPRKLWHQVEQKAFLERCKSAENSIIPNVIIHRKYLSLPTLQPDSTYRIKKSLSVDYISSLFKSKTEAINVLDWFKNGKSSNRSLHYKVHVEKMCSLENISSDVGSEIHNTHPSPILLKQNTDVNCVGNYYKYPCRESLTKSDDCASVCSSVSLNKFIPCETNLSSSPSEDLSQLFSQLKLEHEKQLQELLRNQEEEKNILASYFQNSASSRSTSSTQKSLPLCNKEQNLLAKKSSCSKELFPENPIRKYSEKENKAAEKLCAYVRGYLTRRLLHTDRVQQIIETIKESLICALDLRREPTLKPMDLELNTRLIQQVTSACYELHDVFSSPVAERMAIISADREIKLKRASRPSSASVSSATKQSVLRKQKSEFLKPHKMPTQTSRPRAKSCSSGSRSLNTNTGYTGPSSIKRCSSSHNNRQPWR